MNNDRNLLIASMFTFVTISLWIFFELVKTVKTTTVPVSVEQVIKPLSPKLDTDTITKLGTKVDY